MTWSAQQEAALKNINVWFNHSDQQVFRLFGFAGTGKSTLAKEIAEEAEKSLFAAFTGKAALVMRRKGCRGASTIHSMIYEIKDQVDGQPVFALNEESELKDADLLVIDECSMIDEAMGKDLLSFGTKILVIGDPAQLPPVKGAGFFTDAKPDFMLTEVHRQAKDNPIVAMSMKIREGDGLDVGSYGSSKVILRSQITPGEILATDQVIVGMNKTRMLYNDRIRELLERQRGVPVKKDKLICLRNNRAKGLFNGSMWEVDSIKKKKRCYHMHVESADDGRATPAVRIVDVRQEFFTGTEAEVPWQARKGTQEFTFGYAITCHKSQGSQWGNTVVFDESGAFREDADRWLYTAVTRASEQLTLVVRE